MARIRLFGTDGVRGVANKELTGAMAFALGQAYAFALMEDRIWQPTVAVGYDTRVSGDMLKAALMSGICSAGAFALDLGVLPTPGVAYVSSLHAHAGVVISASHNPAMDNGIKFFDDKGRKIPDALEDRIEALTLHLRPDMLPDGDQVGTIKPFPQAAKLYEEHLRSLAPAGLSGKRIVLDASNGAASQIAPSLFCSLGAEVTALSCKPDGLNINLQCGSTHPEALQKAVVELKADIGLAFDGDADRLIAVDEKGALFDGDQALAVCALHRQRQGKLPLGKVVGTVMSNLGLKILLKEHGMELIAANVGDRYVLEAMLEGGHPLGGEQSGHLIFQEHSTTGDGMLAALQILGVMLETGQPLSELASCMKRFPQVIINVPAKGKGKLLAKNDPEIQSAIQALEQKYGEKGRVLLRPSGTEPLVRLMIEGEDRALIEQDAKNLADFLLKKIQR